MNLINNHDILNSHIVFIDTIMAPTNNRKSYTAEYKLKIVAFAEENSNRKAEREFGISEKIIRDWRKAKDSLQLTKKQKKANRGHKPRWPKLEQEVCEWVLSQRTNGRALSTVQLRLKAKAMAKEMNVDDFIGGPSWCFRFMQRNDLSIRSRTTLCQALPADFHEKVTNFRRFVKGKIDEHGITLDRIINMDEVPLTFDIPLNRTVNAKGEKTVNIRTTGHEKTHFTVVLACCADGKKLPPLIIFKRKTMPRESFPPGIIIQMNQKGWMDEKMMDFWLQRVFCTRTDGFFKTKRALLVMDSMRAHITEKIKETIHKMNTIPAIIPGGLTKVLQPLDISVNRSFKTNLRRQWEDWMTDGKHSFTDGGRMRHATYAQVTEWIIKAWEDINIRSITSGFRKAQIVTDEQREEEDEDEEDEEESRDINATIAQLLISDTEDEDFDGFTNENIED